jgi:hypothetical protein
MEKRRSSAQPCAWLSRCVHFKPGKKQQLLHKHHLAERGREVLLEEAL